MAAESPADAAALWAHAAQQHASACDRRGQLVQAACSRRAAEALAGLAVRLRGVASPGAVAAWETARCEANETGVTAWGAALREEERGNGLEAAMHREVSHAMACFALMCEKATGWETTKKTGEFEGPK